ncbi:hypothetical protein [Mucilaginibacter sp.]|jgi:hypothetical protein|uniref:hypothetical protein n=1 Tax=Mucilaginibacter sp. TaxID=1882438 RepID=UPI002C4CFC51|nr:hypothetical protein [Mucilaginibacter sp.]HTI60691.1 hypothetical protein [Mucilaginibacter sp.]
MQKIKTFRLIISIAALVFVAKPFAGFGTLSRQFKPIVSHTILVKSFTKRKPESLEDADEKLQAIHKVLTNPLLSLLSAISFFLSLLLPSIVSDISKLTEPGARWMPRSARPAYLLAGKLTI